MVFDKVVDYCRQNNISLSAFEKKCSLSNAATSKWKNGKSIPSIPSLEKIAAATGIPMSVWLGDGSLNKEQTGAGEPQ